MILLRQTDPADGGTAVGETPAEKIARLESELASSQKIVSDYKSRDELSAATELEVEAKTQKGLTRDQAIAVIKRQKAFDAETERQWAQRRPEVIEFIKEFPKQRDLRAALNHHWPGIVGIEEIDAARRQMAAQ